jgi:hypothetical protein
MSGKAYRERHHCRRPERYIYRDAARKSAQKVLKTNTLEAELCRIGHSGESGASKLPMETVEVWIALSLGE